MFKEWNNQLLKKVKSQEVTKGDILERVIHETFDDKTHTMLVKDNASLLDELYDSFLEQADLYDFINIERIYDRSD